jgi:uncharacterized protein
VNLGEITAQVLAAATPISRDSDDHGPRHWRDVARVSYLLNQSGVEADLELTFLFALFHDSQREDEFDDPEHGARAAALLETFIARGDLPGSTVKLLPILIEHDQGDVSEDPLSAACWDADRLTLWRVGIIPDPKYISTAAIRNDFVTFSRAALHITRAPDRSWEELIERIQSDV